MKLNKCELFQSLKSELKYNKIKYIAIKKNKKIK